MVSCLAGITRLLEHGYAGPAAMVLRGMFETAVNLQVILKEDTAFRCQLFEEFLFIERYQRMGSTPATPEQRARNETDYSRVRSNYHPTRPYSWSWKAVPSDRMSGKSGPDNPTFKELCQHIGHPEYYEELYGRLSAAIHPVPSYETWMRRSDGHMELGPNFTDHVPHLATVSIALAVDSLVRVAMGLDLPDSLEFSQFGVRLLLTSSDGQS
jgi:Family of unknown function (DUF5677)